MRAWRSGGWSVLAVLGLLACVACGPPAITPQVREIAGPQAATAIREASDSTRDASVLALRAQELQMMILGGDLSGFDISGLPPPASLDASAARADAIRVAHAGSQPRTRQGGEFNTSGCVVPDTSSGAARARYVAHGAEGCDSPDHVTVNYANGDRVEYEYEGDSSGVTIRMRVVSGDYAGSYVTYQISWDNVWSTVTITMNGELLYFHFGQQRMDIQYNTRYEYGTHTDVFARFDGEIRDLVRHRHVTSDITARMQDVGTGEGNFEESWTGNARIAQSTATEGGWQESDVVEYRNLNVLWRVTSLVGYYDERWDASGVVLYNGTEVGHLEVAGRAQVVIRWTDGQTTDFDFTELLILSPF